jgi:hypothetical protein
MLNEKNLYGIVSQRSPQITLLLDTRDNTDLLANHKLRQTEENAIVLKSVR